LARLCGVGHVGAGTLRRAGLCRKSGGRERIHGTRSYCYVFSSKTCTRTGNVA
jgi:hypothetical protein